jgi:antitoxin (DNA-binding transcriptional repressor) of toxin-antitoxin stability system
MGGKGLQADPMYQLGRICRRSMTRCVVQFTRGGDVMTISLEEFQSRMREILAELPAVKEVTIVDAGRPQATLTPAEPTAWPCQAGSAAHLAHWMADDFDAPLEDFREYMQ